MKLIKALSAIFILLFLLTFLVSCDGNSSSQNQNEIQQFQNIYFNYPLRDYPVGKAEGSQLYWNCSENDFCSTYNGAFHSGEDWNLKGGNTGEIDEGKPVYSIGEGMVIYAKEEKDGLGNNIGFRVVIEHIGNCVIPAKENIGDSSISYEEEVVDKIYSVYLHLKDVQFKVGDKIKIDSVIGYITKAGTGSHLHFEIRKEGKIIYDSYFGNIQQIIDLGFRDPSEFIEANMIESKVAKGSSQTIPEENSASGVSKESVKILYNLFKDGHGEIFIDESDKPGFKNITNNPAADMNPVLSPDQKKIVFLSDRNGEEDFGIYIMNVDGSDVIQLTDNLIDVNNLCFSPDGKKIAFNSKDEIDDWCDIYIMNADGSGKINLTGNSTDNSTDNSKSGYMPCFSPDGKKIAFQWQDESTGNTFIYIMNADGSNKTQITDDSIDVSQDLCFSPDGKKIAFTSFNIDNVDIYLINVDGSDMRQLTDHPSHDMKPCFSHDGKKIAFKSVREGDGVIRIYIMDIYGSNQRLLLEQSVFDLYRDFYPPGRQY